MPALVSKKFRIHNAKQFVEAFDEDKGFTTFANTSAGDTSLETNMYLFIGGISAFSDDTNPPTPTDSVANSYFSNWRDMIAAKKITSSDVSHCITRRNWANDNPYFAYTHANNALYDQSFYVMTDDYNVYKCLANNAGSGNSTAKPTETGTTITTPGSDGYRWKFMYTISATKALKFVTNSYIPVQQIRHANAAGQFVSNGMPDQNQENEKQRAVEAAATNGEINIINIDTAGSNYNFEASTVGSGQTGYTHTTTSVKIHSGASANTDHYNGYSIYFIDGPAANDLKVISDYDGAGVITVPTLSGVPVDGNSFVISPTVTVTGDGTGASVRATGTTGSGLTGLTVLNAGSGYSNAVITIAGNTSSTPTPVNPTATAVIEPYGGHGYDAIKELGGYNVIVNTRLENTEGGAFTVANDFRKIGLLAQPETSAGAVADATTYDQAVTIKLQTFAGNAPTADQLITGAQSGATARVIDYTSGNTTLRVCSVTHGSNTTSGYDGAGSWQTGGDGEAITFDGGGTTANTQTVTAGALKPFSGDILYTENRSPVSRASDQIEDVKLIVNF